MLTNRRNSARLQDYRLSGGLQRHNPVRDQQHDFFPSQLSQSRHNFFLRFTI